MKRLVIIDGKSVFYRGYYAMGALSTSSGIPTGGVYGFAAIAMEIVRDLKPTKVVVAWDKAKTSTSKRIAIYPGYKAGRVKPPDDFYAQIPYLRDLIVAFGWGFLETDNYEADDIIGTLALQADNEGDYETFIISSDLDMLQIVDENTKMYRVLKGFTNIEEIDVETVEKKYGIKKNQFLDLKAIKGDASDNIPGVPGIGEKGAVKLLNDFGSLEGVYKNIEQISGATRRKLEEGRDSAFMSYKLAKIDTTAPVKLSDIPDLKLNVRGIIEELKILEFRSLERKFKNWLVEDGVTLEKTATNKEEAESDDDKSLPEDTIVSWDIKSLMHRNGKIAEEILAGKSFYDLSQGRFLLNPLQGVRDNTEKMTLFEDKDDLRREYWRQQREFAENPKLNKIFMQFDLPLIPILYKMEVKGMLISREFFSKMRLEYEAYVHKLEQKIYSLSGNNFNINSPIQLSAVLFEKMNLPTTGIKKTTRGYSTGAKELDKLKDFHPLIPVLIEYREASKLLNTYIIPLPDLADGEGRIHTTFTQDVTATGRLSSLNPNLQNIPIRTDEGRRIREGFIVPDGKVLISADYAQFELRLAAVLSGDEKLIDDFNSGVDIHTKTASEVFGVSMEDVTKLQRRAAKVINFGVLYGMSAKGLSDATGMTVPEARDFIDSYFEVRKPIREKLNEILEQARRDGYVETFFGRRRPTPDVKSPNYLVRTGAERAAQNMPIQGTEADLMKRAMIQLSHELPDEAEIIMQVHDSLIVEATEEKRDVVKDILKRVMEGIAPELKIKLSVDIKYGKNWGEI